MQDTMIPDNKWEFDQKVTDCFDDMLSRSIPQYEVMRNLTFEIARNFAVNNTEIADIGCSNGLSLERFIKYFGNYNRFIGIEISDAMIEECHKKFDEYIKAGIVDIRKHDLRQGLPYINPCIVLSILTIQFTPIEYRLKIMKDIYDRLLPGGCFIFIEKVIGNSVYIDNILVEKYYQIKSDNGYSQEQIYRKKNALEGVLVPVTAKWNEELLKISGFNQFDCFWRYLNFSGWIAVK